MTIRELIERLDREKMHNFPQADLMEYLNEVEADVAEQMHKTDVPVYVYDHDLDTELLAPAPYDRLYISYIKAMIDYANEEYASYQLNQEQYDADMFQFINWIVRTQEGRENSNFPRRLKHTW